MIRYRIRLLLAVLLAFLACCANPNLQRSIDVRLQESDPQRLIIRNQMSTPVRLEAQPPLPAVEVQPSGSVEILFRVLSVGSFDKAEREPYYVPTSATRTNHLGEIDNFGLVDVSSPAPEIHYRDQNGHAHIISFDLNNCNENRRWEDAHWTRADHSGQILSPLAGVPELLCPAGGTRSESVFSDGLILTPWERQRSCASRQQKVCDQGA